MRIAALHQYLLGLSLALLTACGSTAPNPIGLPGRTSPPADGVAAVPAVTGDTDEMSYRVQPEFPQGINGCSCALRVDQRAPLERGYLLVYGYDGPGTIILDGEPQLLELAVDNQQVIADEQLVTRLENEAYAITVELTNEGQTGDEIWAYGGSVYVRRKADGKALSFRVRGECGC
jgi:hypothetical protein